MEDKIIFGLIGAIVGLLTAIVTTWLNKRVFREEIAESEILKSQLEVCKSIWENVIKIDFEASQLLDEASSELNKKMQEKKIPKDQILLQISEYFVPKSKEILINVMVLKKYYATIPASLIESLKHYENLIWKIFKEGNFDQSDELVKASENVCDSIREGEAKIIKRKIKISESIATKPNGGYFPEYRKK
ncbi:hypothetical protein KAU32_02350 [bacterium]|nr:hypothetical protein [bacterium]